MDVFRFPARILFIALVAGAVGLAMLACGDDPSSKGIDVVKPRLVKTSSGQRSFTGTLVNRRTTTLSIAQVEVALYDDEGSPVETIRIEVRDVPSQDSVNFSGKIDSAQPFRQAQVQSVLTP